MAHSDSLPMRCARGVAALALVTAGAMPTAHAAPSDLHLDALVVRASAHETQNAVGNAFGLQVGLSPRLWHARFPVGLRLLGEYGALRTTQHRYFSVPSVQMLLDWRVAPRLELDVGAGAQFWLSPASGAVARPIITAEAHYVPPGRLWRVIRSGYVAASFGASGGAGLTVRAGVEFAFGPRRQNEMPPQTALHLLPVTSPVTACPAPVACPPVVVCPPVRACPPCPTLAAAAARGPKAPLRQDLVFAFNSAVIERESQDYLRALAEAMVADPGAWQHLSIVGHGNSIGTEAHNLTVSAHRAHAVAHFLMHLGVPENKLSVRAVGETEPLLGVPVNAAAQRRVALDMHPIERDGPLQRFMARSAEPGEEAQR